MSIQKVLKNIVLYDWYLFVAYIVTKILFDFYYIEFPKNNGFFPLFFGLLFITFLLLFMPILSPFKKKIAPGLLLIYFLCLSYNSLFRNTYLLGKSVTFTILLIDGFFFVPLGCLFYRTTLTKVIKKNSFFILVMLIGWLIKSDLSVIYLFFVVLIIRFFSVIIGFFVAKMVYKNRLKKKNVQQAVKNYVSS